MPFVRIRGYLFGFYVSEPHYEPPHVHVEGQGGSAKIWLRPVRTEKSSYSKARTREIVRIVREQQDVFAERWRTQFGDR